MPVQPTYPGVYVEEVPATGQAIQGVATSITAFLGRAARGRVNDPTMIFSIGDYQTLFGEIGYEFPMSCAVFDFFTNGGVQAVIVRIADAAAAAATANAGALTFAASSPGAWANVSAQSAKPGNAPPAGLSVRFDTADSAGSPSAGHTLSVFFQFADGSVQTEIYPNVALTGDVANRIDRVLAQKSNFVTIPGYADPGDHVPLNEYIAFSGGADGGPIKDYIVGDQEARTGLYSLERTDLFNVLCIPPDNMDAPDGGLPDGLWAAASAYCVSRRAMLIVEPPQSWADAAKKGEYSAIQPSDLGVTDEGSARNCAVYFPRIYAPDPAGKAPQKLSSACGVIAGVWAATDANRGVWKAPAGVEAGLNGIGRLEFDLTDQQNGLLNPLGINCLRNFPVIGAVIWGARTLRGADALDDDYKYIPVRRLTLYIEESLYRGTKFAVFEPNDETLWSQLRLAVDAFMADLARQGAFYNYKVACDATTTTQCDIDRGVVNVQIAFAPESPETFIVLQIQQQAGQAVA